MKLQKYLAITVLLAVSSMMTFAQGPGAATYASKCAMCHAADGSGNSPAGKAMKTPSLHDPAVVAKSDADLIATTKKGKGKMPEYGTKLSDEQIKDAIAYIRTLQKK